jgi:hypothetical protein
LGTLLAGGTVPAPVSAITVTPPTATSQPSPQPAATDAPIATNPPPTAAPTAYPAPPAQPSQPAADATQVPCYRAKFDAETVPDGTAMAPGQSFTKTWTLKNDGSCQWTSDFSIVFISGDAMSGPAAQPLTGTVAPGQSVQISLDLKAPSTEGSYRGNFKLRNAAGAIFGLGPAADQDFWVDIKVTTPTGAMIDSYCLARWTTDAGTLSCPGSQGDAHGFVIRVDSPKLEDGSVDNEPALVTAPPVGNNAQITGRFLPVTIPSGAHFKTVVGCMYGAANCSVKFTLKYSADHGIVQSLGEWNEKTDGKITHVDVDLSSLAGRSVELFLIVTANSASSGQQAFWLDPQVK